MRLISVRVGGGRLNSPHTLPTGFELFLDDLVRSYHSHLKPNYCIDPTKQVPAPLATWDRNHFTILKGGFLLACHCTTHSPLILNVVANFAPPNSCHLKCARSGDVVFSVLINPWSPGCCVTVAVHNNIKGGIRCALA